MLVIRKIKQSVKELICSLPEPHRGRAYAVAKKALLIYRVIKNPVYIPPVTTVVDSSEVITKEDRILVELKKVGSFAPYIKDFQKPLPPVYSPVRNAPDGILFLKLLRSTERGKIDIVLLCPWLIRGGADLIVLNIANHLSKLGQTVLVVTTENKSSTWIGKLLPEVRTLNFGLITDGLSEEQKKYLLGRLLLQLRPKTIHCLQSNLGFETFSAFYKSLKNFSRLYASFYADGFCRDGLQRGYVSKYLQCLAPNLDLLISDQLFNPAIYERIYGINIKKWKALYGLVKSERNYLALNNQRKSILWASRFDNSKLPDLLEKIIKRFPDKKFHIYGEPYRDELLKKYNKFKQYKNVELHGAYDSFSNIDKTEIFAFLYTSESDGLPNILLEAASEGIPIISSSVGGIGSFLNDENSWLVRNNDEEEFSDVIQKAFNNKELTYKKAKEAKRLIDQRHSEEIFEKTLKEIYHI